MAYKITGRILNLGDLQSITSTSTGKSYNKRDVVISAFLFDSYTGQPTEDVSNTPKFTFFGNRCQDLEQFKAGDMVVIGFEINGRSYQKDGKTEYFTEVRPTSIYESKQSFSQSSTPSALPAPNDPFGPSAGIITDTTNTSDIGVQPIKNFSDELPF